MLFLIRFGGRKNGSLLPCHHASDDIFRRRLPKYDHYNSRPVDLDWEYYALKRTFSHKVRRACLFLAHSAGALTGRAVSSQLSREACVIVLRLSIGSNPQAAPSAAGTVASPAPWVRPQDVPARAAALLQVCQRVCSGLCSLVLRAAIPPVLACAPLQVLDLQQADIISVSVPSDPSQFGRG